ncbi:MAG: hypothetical protein JRE28_08940 [Deltaproteobacteria bacterium]|nr:hypothetical protein [Deltaproteobacteria bacterium]
MPKAAEKSLGELRDKIDEGTRTGIEDAVKNLKRAMEGEDTDEIKRLTEVLTRASHKMAASVYGQDSGSEEPQHGYTAENHRQNASSGSDDDVVNAEYQEVA